MIRVVLDTNILVSAARSNRGASSELMQRLVGREFAIAISAPLVFEYEEVLVREIVPAFMTLSEVDRLIRFICHVGEKFVPASGIRPALPDADDELVLELAVAGRVQYIVTHNTHDFAPASTFGITAVTPGAFLRELRNKP